MFFSIVSLLLLLQSCNYYCIASPYARHDVTEKFSRDTFMVHFDPRPTIDSSDDGQEEELISLVELVSTKFNKLLIDPILGNNINTSNITNAVAKFNQLHQTTTKLDTPTTKLWVYIPHLSAQDYKVHFSNGSYNPTKYLENVRNSLEASNNIFSGTVEGLILDAGHFLHPKNQSIVRANITNIKRIFRNQRTFSYKVGILFPKRDIFSNTTQRKIVTDIITEIDACCVMTVVNPTASDIDSGVNTTILRYQQIMEETVKEIKSLNGTQNTAVIFRTEYPDTSNNSKAKNLYGDLVHYWQSMNEWAVRKNTTVAMAEAFDVPARNSPASRSLGWWKAVNDQENYDVEYKEKTDFLTVSPAQNQIQAQELIDMDDTYIRQDEHFNFKQNSHFSVHFNPHLPMTSFTTPEEINSTLAVFLQKFLGTFGRISVRDKDMYNLEGLETFLDVLAKWNKNRAGEAKETVEGSLTFTAPTKDNTDEERDKIIAQIGMLARTANELHENTISTVQISFYENFNISSDIFYWGIAALASERLGSNNRFGVEIPLNVCKKKFDKIIKPMLSLPHVKVITLKYESKDKEMKAGNAFEKITEIFQVCRKRIEKAENGTGVSSGIEAVLSVGSRYINETGEKKYEDFVKFWGEVNTWSEKTSSSVVMMEAFDKAEKRGNNNKGKGELGLGWWEVVKNDDNVVRTEFDYTFVEKRKALLEELPEADPIGESTTQVPEISENVENATDTHEGMSDEEFWFWVNCLVPTGCAVIVSAILAVLLIWRLKRNQREMTKEEMREFISGNSRFSDNLGEEQYINSKYNTDLYEIPLQNIAFDSVVGYGKCAIVYKASLADTVVAVKVPKKDCSKQYYKSMLVELKILANVGEHVNVQSFHGANTKDVKKGTVYIITEYCGNGTLYAYLRTLRYNLDAAADGENGKKLDNIYELYKFAYEIACGMKYLSEKDIIHGDLSANNVLLNGENTCKITNFGLSRKVDDSGEYLKRKDNSFPWRWIAVESLKHKIVTSKSDIWSYGVTLWEIFSLSRIPYKGQAVQEGFLEKIERGLRLKRPKYATQDVYDNMMQCWSKNPSDRPQFQEQAEYFLLLMKEELDHMDNKVGI